MSAATPTSPRPSAHFGVLALTVAVFGVAVATVTWQVRTGLRDQIVRREAGWLEAIASMQLEERASTLVEAIEDVPGALLVAVLKTQKLAGISGLRVYDAESRLSDSWMLPLGAEKAPVEFWTHLARGEVIGKL